MYTYILPVTTSVEAPLSRKQNINIRSFVWHTFAVEGVGLKLSPKP